MRHLAAGPLSVRDWHPKTQQEQITYITGVVNRSAADDHQRSQAIHDYVDHRDGFKQVFKILYMLVSLANASAVDLSKIPVEWIVGWTTISMEFLDR